MRRPVGGDKGFERPTAIPALVFEQRHTVFYPSAGFRDRDRCGAEHVVADRVAVTHDPDDTSVLFGAPGGNGADGFVAQRIERLSVNGDTLHPEPFQLREELPPDHLDPLKERVRRCGLTRRVNRPIQVVDDVEQIRENLAAAALDVLADLAP